METEATILRRIAEMEHEIEAVWKQFGGIYFMFGSRAKQDIIDGHQKDGDNLDEIIAHAKKYHLGMMKYHARPAPRRALLS